MPQKSNRFDYVKYDQKAIEDQATFKTIFQLLETRTDTLIVSPRAKALVFTKLEEAYCWVGKAIRDDQIARNDATTLEEGRGNE